MVLLYPKKIETANDYNYKLAEYIKQYIEKRGETVQLSRKSVDAPEIEAIIVQKTINPDIFIGLYTGDYTGGSYIIVCDNYSALAGNYNYMLKDLFGDPAESKTAGLDILGELKFSKVNDITLHLPALIADYTDAQLDDLAKRIVEESFWYPIKTKTDTDTANNSDPYMYRFPSSTTWHEVTAIFKQGQDYKNSFGDIKEDTSDPNHIIRYLELISKVSGNYDIEQPEELPVPQHYTWEIPLVSLPSTARTIILNAKGNTGGETLYIKIGVQGASYSTSITTYQDFTETLTPEYKEYKFTVPATLATLTALEVGVIGSGTINITGVWITATTDNYNKYPQGYRDEIEPESQTTIPDKPGITLTLGKTLAEKAADKINAPDPTPEQETSEDPAGGASTATTEGFGNALSDILGTLEGNPAIVDLSSVMKIDVKALEDKVNSTLDFGKKLDLSKAKEKLDGIKNAALGQAASIKKIAEDKIAGLNTSLNSNNLLANAKSMLPKLPTTEVTNQISTIKSDITANTDFVKDNAAKLGNNLTEKVQIADTLSAAKDKINTAKNMLDSAKSAVDSAKTSMTSKLSTISGGKISL